jgi:short subunit dehydrogenase-like uncharacterized protein
MIKRILLDYFRGNSILANPFLLYGSYGYTGSLIAELAVRRGMRPILSGRDAERLKRQAGQLNFEYRVLSLDDQKSLESVLGEVPLVLNCAGPFQRTYRPVVEACLKLGRHYLDITGEIQVFEALAARNEEARRAGVMVLPGVGFDVVPTDCLAAHLKKRLPDATSLTLAILGLGGGSSRGTLLTSVEGLSKQGVIRRDGKLRGVPLAGKRREIDFGSGPRTVLNIPWGDVSTAYYSTGIPNIETFMAFPKSFLRIVRILRPFRGLAGNPVVQSILKNLVMRLPPGPTIEQRQVGHSRLWGEARNDAGQKVISRLETPNGYDLTAQTALAAVERVQRGEFKPGFQTPAMAYGADFILEFESVKREDLKPVIQKDEAGNIEKVSNDHA